MSTPPTPQSLIDSIGYRKSLLHTYLNEMDRAFRAADWDAVRHLAIEIRWEAASIEYVAEQLPDNPVTTTPPTTP